MNRHLVLGHKGEVGSALMKVLADKYEVIGLDLQNETYPTPKSFDVLHVAIPFSDKFVDNVHRIALVYLKDGGLIINHSTVPVGTTRRIINAVHSPIRGVHPNLEAGIRTFVKFCGGTRSTECIGIFAPLGITTYCTAQAETTEAAKLLDLVAYGWNILLEKEIHQFCEDRSLPFETLYTAFTETYNEGFRLLGRSEVTRPVLRHVPGPIGGHCVTQAGCEFLAKDFWPAALIKQTNEEKYAEDQADEGKGGAGR